MQVRTVGVCLKAGQPQAAATVRELVKWLSERQLEIRVDAECASLVGLPGSEIAELAGEVDLIVSLGGESVAKEIDSFLQAPKIARTLDLSARRALGMFRLSWWALPAQNTLDRAASMLPGLLYERLPEAGIDFAVVYPTLGLMVSSIDDADSRRVVARAFNRFYAESFDPFARRVTPAAVIPMHTPEEAIAELDYAVGELGLRAVVVAGHVLRPLPGKNSVRSWDFFLMK